MGFALAFTSVGIIRFPLPMSSLQTRPDRKTNADSIAYPLARLCFGLIREKAGRAPRDRSPLGKAGASTTSTRGLRRCFGMKTAVVTAFADNEIGRLLEDFILQGGVDTDYMSNWKDYDGIGRIDAQRTEFHRAGLRYSWSEGNARPRQYGSLANEARRCGLGSSCLISEGDAMAAHRRHLSPL